MRRGGQIKRQAPIARGAPPKRSGKPKAVNRARKQRNHERAYGEKRDWVVTLPCLICGYSPCDPAHVGTAGAGMKAGSERLVPLCSPHVVGRWVGRVEVPVPFEGHHRESHRGIKTFQRKFGIDLKEEAERIERLWQNHLSRGVDDGE